MAGGLKGPCVRYEREKSVEGPHQAQTRAFALPAAAWRHGPQRWLSLWCWRARWSYRRTLTSRRARCRILSQVRAGVGQTTVASVEMEVQAAQPRGCTGRSWHPVSQPFSGAWGLGPGRPLPAGAGSRVAVRTVSACLPTTSVPACPRLCLCPAASPPSLSLCPRDP